jgi:hypothetical protein
MIELDGSRYITGSEAACIAGISPGALRMRRKREGADRHPSHVQVSSATVLYLAEEFSRYAATWINQSSKRAGR